MVTEQHELIEEVKKYWSEKLFQTNTAINHTKVKEGIDWLYGLRRLEPPPIIFVESPMMSRFAVQYLKIYNCSAIPTDFESVRKKLTDAISGALRYHTNSSENARLLDDYKRLVYDALSKQLKTELYRKVRNQIDFQIKSGEASEQVKTQYPYTHVWTSLTNNVRNFNFDLYEHEFGVYDYSVVATWDILSRLNIIDPETFAPVKSLYTSGIYEAILMKNYCVICSMPEVLERDDEGRLHTEDGPAIKFRDGYEQYYWHGVLMPKNWITQKENIHSLSIYSEGNAEQRRCLMEMLGDDIYHKTLLADTVLIDADTDKQGNVMKLYKSKYRLTVTGKYLQYLQVVCPSTKRQYIICPPNQNSKTVWQAKASTFSNAKIQIRHGDVGLLNVNKPFTHPIYET